MSVDSICLVLEQNFWRFKKEKQRQKIETKEGRNIRIPAVKYNN